MTFGDLKKLVDQLKDQGVPDYAGVLVPNLPHHVRAYNEVAGFIETSAAFDIRLQKWFACEEGRDDPDEIVKPALLLVAVK